MIAIFLALALIQPANSPVSPTDAPPIPSTTTRIVVRPTDMDSKQHVNNARYIEYLQQGRWEYLEKKGFPDERLKAIKAVPVVVNLNVNYRKPCKYGDIVEVETWVKAVDGKKIVFGQVVRKADGQEAVDATVTMVTIDPDTGKSVVVSEDLTRAIGPR